MINLLPFLPKKSPIVFLFLFVFFSLSAAAQEKYQVIGKVEIENGTLDGVNITLFKNAEKVRTNLVGKKGKFVYKLDYNNDYMLEFTKEGFVAKKVSISTYVPDEVLEGDNRFPPFHFKVNLFPMYEGIDLSVFDQPMGMITYDKELDDFDYDKAYDKQIRDAIKKAEEAARKKALEFSNKNKALEKAYKDAVAEGDFHFRKEVYDKSKTAYLKALEFKANDTYLKGQLAKIDALTTQREQLLKEKGFPFREYAEPGHLPGLLQKTFCFRRLLQFFSDILGG